MSAVSAMPEDHRARQSVHYERWINIELVEFRDDRLQSKPTVSLSEHLDTRDQLCL